jgi:hypothetical protein
MAWEQNNLSIDIAEEFAIFADLSREDFRREMRVKQQSERRRSRRKASLGLSRAIVKRNCVECGKEFEDTVHRQGDPAQYCCTPCSRRVRNRRYKANKKARALCVCTYMQQPLALPSPGQRCWCTAAIYGTYGAVIIYVPCQ